MNEKLDKDSGFILEAKGITKQFPGVIALNKVDFQLRSKTVHALLGENGAGKSTLIKIFCGVYHQDDGQIFFCGKPLENVTPEKAIRNGIAVIHQELNLVPELSIAENIYIGRELCNKFGIVDFDRMNKQSMELLKKFDLKLSPSTKIKELSIAYQQMIEILKALSLNAQVIIMDEPTDVLTDEEVKKLFKIIKDLRNEGKAIIYITHKLEELQEICDEYTIFRDGHFIAHGMMEDVTRQDIINLMVGRKLTEQYPFVSGKPEKEVLRVEHLCRKGVLEDISFSAWSGEVLGVFGLIGAGRTELARAIIGADKFESGNVFINGKQRTINSPLKAIQNDIYYTTEDRKKDGAFLHLGTGFNMTISSLDAIKNSAGILSSSKEKTEVKEKIKELSIKVFSQEVELKNLSGGNQQKVLLARGLLTNPKIMILDEPTRGIDVGAKTEIYQIINQLKANGVAVIVISSEMAEVLGISDRLMVMYQGKVITLLDRKDMNEKNVMQSAFGLNNRREDK